jgi:hypothetical protein
MTDKEFFTHAIEDLTARNTFLRLEISIISKGIKDVRAEIKKRRKGGELMCCGDTSKVYGSIYKSR